MVLVKTLTFSLSLLYFKIGLNIPLEYPLEIRHPFVDYKKDETLDFFKGVS